MHELYIYKKILTMLEMLDSPWLSFDLEVSDSVFMAATPYLILRHSTHLFQLRLATEKKNYSI